MRLASASEYNNQLRTQLKKAIDEIKKTLELRQYGKGQDGKASFTNDEVRQAVLAAIRELAPTATNQATGAAVSALIPAMATGDKAKLDAVSAAISRAYDRQASNGITVVLVAEKHQYDDNDDEPDQARTKELLKLMVAGQSLASTSLVALERDLELRYKPYPTGFSPTSVTESSLTDHYDTTLKQGLSRAQRNSVIAGYVVLSLAGGDQSTKDSVVLFLGEEHKGILEEFEYFAKSSVKASGLEWISKRPRTLLSFASQS